MKRIFKTIFRALVGLLFRVDVHGTAQAHERTLVVANHESLIDGMLLWLFLPFEATFIVHTQIAAHPLYKIMLRLVPHLAVDPLNPLSMKKALRLIESGRPVVIFPEGRITVTGSLMKIYDGAAFLAAKSGATVLPVRLTGAGQTYFSRLAGVYPRKLLPKLSIHLRPPTRIEMTAQGSAKERRRRAGEDLRQILLEMLIATRPSRTIFEAFLDAQDTFGPKYRVAQDVRLVEESYRDLTKRALAVARLAPRFSQDGEAVGLLLPNIAPTLSVFLGLSAVNRVPAMMNYTAGAEGLQAAIELSKLRTVLTLRSFVEKAKLEATLSRLRGVEVIYLEDFKSLLGLKDKLWVLSKLMRPRSLVRQRDPNRPAVILFTSGSEGMPKGVVHSHESILANVAQVRSVADFMPQDRFMVALPVFHSFGFTCGVILPLIAGCRVFLYPSPLHYRVIPELVYDRNCTVLFGTNSFLANYARFAHPYDFGRLRYVIAGAEKLNEEVRRTWMDRFGVRILEGYGATETAPVIAVNVPMANKPGSVGRLLPGIQAQLEAVPGIEQGGILHVRGPNLMLGYMLHQQPGLIQHAESPIGTGWYSTGDVVEIDDNGFVHIRGRVKRFAKVAGEMVSLEVVEKIAARTAPEAMHAATSRPDPAKGEQIILFTTDDRLDRAALLGVAREAGIPELAVPRVLRYVDAIPLLGTGKTDYVRLKKMAEEEIGAGA
ncbi:MAG TPA: bifunctional acyl-ACP--phospholipid O-acyltransferase/long-chain-fatty-acid--ACP ligase [Burkholderiales bacterium]|nr:bifunctional acyl-ACP--phospholipid O-acyltransferase/long-chain-fatty-acid--ACP ligase [Burkholderiales bacterium]